MWLKPILEKSQNARACNGSIDGKIHRSADADYKRALRFDFHRLPFPLQLPRAGQRPAAKTPKKTRVVEKVSWE